MSESMVFDWLQTIRIELSLAGLNMILSPPILNYSPGCNIREGKKEQWHVNSSQAAKHAFFCLYYFDLLRVICIKTLLGVQKILCSSLSISLFNFFSISLTHFISVKLRLHSSSATISLSWAIVESILSSIQHGDTAKVVQKQWYGWVTQTMIFLSSLPPFLPDVLKDPCSAIFWGFSVWWGNQSEA